MEAFALIAGTTLAILALAATAYVLGRTLWSAPLPGPARWVVPASLGLAGLAHLGLLLGLLGWLKPVPVLLAAVAIHLLGLPAWRELVRGVRDLRRHPRLLLVAVAALAPTAVPSLYPPTGFDATLYHLPYARAFVESGGVPFLADRRFPVFPQANEVLFAEVMLFAPDVAAQGVQWLTTVLTAALVGAWGREAFGPAAGWLAAAIFLGNPIVVYLGGTAYIEPGLTLFVTAALFGLHWWRSSGEARWLIFAAVLAASAAAAKYVGLFFVALVGLTALLGGAPAGERRPRWRAAALAALAAGAVLAPWYGRTVIHTGNPVFPFFPQVFGSTPWDPLPFQSILGGGEGRGIVKDVLLRLGALLRLPWDLVFERQKYNSQPFSPLYLAVLPWTVVVAVRDARVRFLLAVAAAYTLIVFSLPPDARYILCVVPLVSLAAAGALQLLLARFRRFWTVALCVGCLLPGWLYAAYHLDRLGRLPLTPEGREAYLTRRVPLYPAVAWLNRTRGSGYTVWALNAEEMAFYARGRFLGDWIGPASFARVLGGVRRPEDLHDRLRRLGAGYVLVSERSGGLPFPEDAAFRRWFKPVYADPHARIFELAEPAGEETAR